MGSKRPERNMQQRAFTFFLELNRATVSRVQHLTTKVVQVRGVHRKDVGYFQLKLVWMYTLQSFRPLTYLDT